MLAGHTRLFQVKARFFGINASFYWGCNKDMDKLVQSARDNGGPTPEQKKELDELISNESDHAKRLIEDGHYFARRMAAENHDARALLRFIKRLELDRHRVEWVMEVWDTAAAELHYFVDLIMLQSEGDNEKPNTNAPERAQKAYRFYRMACDANGVAEMNDKGAYDFLRDAKDEAEVLNKGPGKRTEMASEIMELPTWKTFRRNLTQYRTSTRTQKQKPRLGGVKPSGSIVLAKQMDSKELPTRTTRTVGAKE